MTTGWVSHERYMWHDTGRATTVSAGPEVAAGLGALREPGDEAAVPQPRRGRRPVRRSRRAQAAAWPPSTRSSASTRPAYVESIRAMSDAAGGNAGEGTPFGPGSFEIALLAAGGTITAVDAVLDGRVRNAYALVRPARPSRRGRPRPRLLHLRQRRGRHRARARDARSRAGGHRRLGRPPRQRHAEGLLPRPRRAHHLHPPGSLVPSTIPAPWTSAAKAPAPASTSTSRCRRDRGTAPTWRRSTASWFRRSARSGRS